MSASILLDRAEVSNLVEKGQATLTVYHITISYWKLELQHITDNQVQIGLPKVCALEVVNLLMEEGICFTYVA